MPFIIPIMTNRSQNDNDVSASVGASNALNCVLSAKTSRMTATIGWYEINRKSLSSPSKFLKLVNSDYSATL